MVTYHGKGLLAALPPSLRSYSGTGAAPRAKVRGLMAWYPREPSRTRATLD